MIRKESEIVSVGKKHVCQMGYSRRVMYFLDSVIKLPMNKIEYFLIVFVFLCKKEMDLRLSPLMIVIGRFNPIQKIDGLEIVISNDCDWSI